MRRSFHWGRGDHRIPIFTIFISVACIIVYAFANQEADQLALAFYPKELDPEDADLRVHARQFWHLAVNLFFFYGFSRTIETQLTATGYPLAFVVLVLVTNLSFALTANLDTPTIGLSGVVWGYMGMFLFRYPRTTSPAGSSAPSRYPPSCSSSPSWRSTLPRSGMATKST